jgi:hypothetical protein
LHREGYFGPVGVDVYGYMEGETMRLRPLVDLNARLSMAAPAHGVAARVPGKAVLYRQFSTTQGMPKMLLAAQTSRGVNLTRSFDKSRGVIWLTPLLSSITRHAVAYVGSDDGVLEMQRMARIDLA